MATLTLKNVPARLYERLKASAEAHHRSLNREAIHRLEIALSHAPIDPEAFLAEIRPDREALTEIRLDDETLRAARRSGRP